LNCSNLTLEQYKALVLTRRLVGAAGCVVSLGVLGIVLLTSKTKAWENLTKRIYLTNILYTLLYCIAAIAAVNSSRPPSQESAWCEAMGFLLHYTGTLVVIHYCALAFAVMLQVTVPICEAVKKKTDSISPKKAKCLEVFLYLTLFLCPILNTWEPFLTQLPSYGNYGPLCWFRLNLTDNCTANTLDVRFLQAVPFAVVSLTYCVTFTISLITLCGLYYKFHKLTGNIRTDLRVNIPKVVGITVITFVMTAWFIVSALPSKSLSDIHSFSTWLENVTVILAVTTGILVAVAGFMHFTIFKDLCLWGARELKHKCLHCRRAKELNIQHHVGSHLREVGHHNHNEATPLITRSPGVEHHNDPTHTMRRSSHILPITITTPLFTTHLLDAGHLNDPTDTTRSNFSHSPNTTTTPLATAHPPEVDHRNTPAGITCSLLPHSPGYTTTPVSAIRPPEVDHRNNPTHTMCSSSHSSVTTKTPLSITHRPGVDHNNDPTDVTCSNFSHSPVTTTHS